MRITRRLHSESCQTLSRQFVNFPDNLSRLCSQVFNSGTSSACFSTKSWNAPSSFSWPRRGILRLQFTENRDAWENHPQTFPCNSSWALCLLSRADSGTLLKLHTFYARVLWVSLLPWLLNFSDACFQYLNPVVTNAASRLQVLVSKPRVSSAANKHK